MLERLGRRRVDEVVVVSGAYPIEEPTTLLDLDGARVVACPDWALGPGASLRCGLAALGAEVEAALVVLADGPYLDPRAIERVLAHRHRGRRRRGELRRRPQPPGACSRAPLWARIPDDGGRELEVLLVPCDDLTPPGDIDTPDLARGL